MWERKSFSTSQIDAFLTRRYFSFQPRINVAIAVSGLHCPPEKNELYENGAAVMETKITKKNFADWTPYALEKTFGLKSVRTLPALMEWVSASYPVPDLWTGLIETLSARLYEKRSYWNEDEMKMQFIGPFLQTVDFYGEGLSAFSDRPLSAVSNGIELTGTVDWMAAAGVTEPEVPFFFIHEYKRIKMGDADPFGQVLATMFAARTLNADGKPVYGCVVVANFWHFVLLDGDEFSISQGYDACDSGEIAKIWSILYETKKRILGRVAELKAEGWG